MALRTPLSVTPHLYMGDSTGRPLDKGVVYFGEQDKDPEFYPINLFSDDALTKPLAQPVHTKCGYLYDKGDMVEPHAKELIYSVKVLDSYGRKVFYKGAMMRNSWNDDVIEQINTAIIGSADVARQVATDITNDAINNTAVEGGVLADTFVTVTANGVGAVPINLRELNAMQKNLKGYGGVGGGLDDTEAFNKAVADTDEFIINTDESIIDQSIITKPVTIKGVGHPSLKQTTIGKHIIYAGLPTWDENYRLKTVPDVSISGVTFDSMPSALSDDFGALKFAGTENNISKFNRFGGVEAGVSFTANIGHDNTTLCDYMVGVNRFSVVSFGAKHSKVIGLATHNHGDNSDTGYGGVNNNGTKVGVRMAGESYGAIVAASNIRDKVTAVSHQSGSRYNMLTGNYFDNSLRSAIEVTTGSEGRSFGNVYSGFIIRQSGRNGANLQSGNTYRLDGLIAESAIGNTFSAVDAKTTDGDSKVKSHRIVYNNGSGVVPVAGTVITSGTASAVLVKVTDNNYQTVTEGETMPADGELVVKSLTGDYIPSGALSGIGADAIRTYATEGRHRIDVTTCDINGTGVLLGSDCNLVSLVATRMQKEAASIGGDFNIVDVVSDMNTSPIHLRVDGNNNIIRFTDNTLKTSASSIRVYGKNNTIIGNCNGVVFVFGDNNNLDIVCDTLGMQTTASGNIVRGRCRSLLLGTGVNDLRGLVGATYEAEITATTDASGVVVINHGMIKPCAKIQVTNEGLDPKFVTVTNKALTTKTSQLTIYNIDGTPATNEEVKLSIRASI